MSEVDQTPTVNPEPVEPVNVPPVVDPVPPVGPEMNFAYSTKAEINEEAMRLNMPSGTTKDIIAAADKTPNIDVVDTKEGQDWSDTLSGGVKLNTYGEVFLSTLNDTKAKFRQSVHYNGAELFSKQPALPERSNTKLSGARGVMQVMEFLGNGTIFQTALWHSGFWVTFKAPTEAEIVELHRIMTNDKIQFGRFTHGLSFSNITVYTIDRLVDFALQHIYESTISQEGGVSTAQYKEMITCQDIPSLIWGLAATMYPRGFQYRRACINDPLKCNYVLEEMLNVSRLQWVDNNALTDWQKSHMAIRRTQSCDIATIKRYKSEMLKTQSRVVTLTGVTGRVLSITLKTPSIAEHVDSGYKWVAGITDTVQGALGADASTDERNNYINRHGQATVMRQYAHWVEVIEADSNIIEEKDTIELLFDSLSSDDAYRDGFINAVAKYINESTLVVIGIPTYDCPSCATPQILDTPLPRHVNVLPLDVNQLFFALAEQIVIRLRVR